jgi:membrane-associated phospholipid phosphatase
MDFESYALGSIAAISLYDAVGRTRPSYVDCQRDPSIGDCTTSPTASFPSGHTAEAFIAAGLSCANHEFVPIYGNRAMDWLACARDLTLATADGVLRIMGDRHYATDVLAGGAIGFAFGYGLPVFLHYASPWRSRATAFALAPMTGGAPGISAVGTF